MRNKYLSFDHKIVITNLEWWYVSFKGRALHKINLGDVAIFLTSKAKIKFIFGFF